MEKYSLRTIQVMVMAIVITMVGCSNNEDEQRPIAVVGNEVCTQWGNPISQVLQQMENFELMQQGDDGFICYKGNEPISTISYQFDDSELLETTLLMYPTEYITMEELLSSLSEYEYWGQMNNNVEIYINRQSNTLATIGTNTVNNISYYTVGYTIFEN